MRNWPWNQQSKVISNLEKIGFGEAGNKSLIRVDAEKENGWWLNMVSEDLDMPFELEETRGSQRGNVKSKVDFQDE